MTDGRWPKISVVVISLNEAASLRCTVENLQATLPADSQVLVVDDGSTDGSSDFLAGSDHRARLLRSDHLGTAGARNWGAAHSSGDILIFTDAHVAAPPGWWAPLVEVLQNPSVGAVAPSVSDAEERDCRGYGLRLAGPELTVEWLPPQADTPYQVPLLPGCCLAMRRDTFQAVGGFDPGMIRWATIDTEISLRLWLLGYELWVVPQIDVVHLFREDRPYHVEWSWVLHNRLRLAFAHFGRPRITRVVEALVDYEDFPAALSLAVESDVFARRARLVSERPRDDEWFFRKFGAEW